MACVAPTEDSGQDVTPETGRAADTGSTKFTLTVLRMPGEDIDINVAQEVAPEKPDTRASLASPDGAETVVTNTATRGLSGTSTYDGGTGGTRRLHLKSKQ
jgi:hypothetical protein